MQSLVGYTGFVGSNLAQSFAFDGLYNAKNIQDAFGTKPDLLIYSGVRAEKYLANQDAQADLAVIENAIENIKKIKPKRLVLISTIDVYKNPIGVDEDAVITTEGLHPYGLNRYRLEQWVQAHSKESLIVRLPGLYGQNIKKNFIFDLIHLIPAMLNQAKYCELAAQSDLICKCYQKQGGGFYQCLPLSEETKVALKQELTRLHFSALNFTDSRSIFQFYNLAYLWRHILAAMQYGIKKLNIATEPVMVADIYRYIYQHDFYNEIAAAVPHYDDQTKHHAILGGSNGYLFDREFILRDIRKFVEGYR